MLLKRAQRLLVTVFACLLAMPLALFGQNAAAADPVYVGIDGAYGVKNSTSAQAIELGVRAALHEINAAGGVLNGRPIELITKDNRSVAARGKANLEDFAATKDLVAVFGGRFSPVILQQLETVHQKKIIMLDVWGSADGITDHDFKPSYSFRLSLKDAFAMPAMLAHVQAKGLSKVGVLLPNTGWGRSNHNALASAVSKSPNAELVDAVWYNWGERDMLQHYMRLINAGAEAVLLVANDLEASLLMRQLIENPTVKRVPIMSHWGVTGGNMVDTSGPGFLDMDFNVVQTFSFFNAQPGPLSTFKATVKNIAGIDDVTTLPSPVGTGHGYDMMHILAKAIDQAGTTDRSAVRDALEQIDHHEGMVRTYAPPFTTDNHDALSQAQVFMTRYRADGVLVPLDQ